MTQCAGKRPGKGADELCSVSITTTMTRYERIRYLNEILLADMPECGKDAAAFGQSVEEQRYLLRCLMNVRPPRPVSSDFLREQDILLRDETLMKGIVDAEKLPTVAEKSGRKFFDEVPAEQIILWQGDITRLKVDGIVNAANSALLGCFVPGHKCIDNAIHSAAGVELRQACAHIMIKQGYDEPTGKAKITPAYNLPCRFVLHTVGPIISVGFKPTEKDAELLASCYRSCLDLATENNLRSIAFCCISTGEFHYPADAAANVAVRVVTNWLKETGGKMKIVFNVFKDEDAAIYGKIFGTQDIAIA